jgi:hypothetical protein
MEILDKILDLGIPGLFLILCVVIFMFFIISILRFEAVKKLLMFICTWGRSQKEGTKLSEEEKKIYKLDAYLKGVCIILSFDNYLRLAPNEKFSSYLIKKIEYISLHNTSLKRLTLDFNDTKEFNKLALDELTKLIKYIVQHNGIEIQIFMRDTKFFQDFKILLELAKQTKPDLAIFLHVKKI